MSHYHRGLRELYKISTSDHIIQYIEKIERGNIMGLQLDQHSTSSKSRSYHGRKRWHIATGMKPQPKEELLTHGHGERGRVVDGEVKPWEDGGDGDHGHGSGSGPWERRPLAPLLTWKWFCNGGASPLLDGCLGGGIFLIAFDLGFLSLFRLSDSRYQIMTSVERASWAYTNSDWDEFYD